MNEKTVRLEATGEFPFTLYIEKAMPTMEKDEFILEGIASTTNVDHDSERMSADALSAMERSINDGGVPLRVEHSKSENAVIGNVFKAWVDDRNQLHIRARMDKAHPVSPLLYKSMKDGSKMGFSVGGLVKRATKEFVESVGKVVKTFYDVVLKEVSVTPRPANYDAYAMAKSIASSEEDAESLRGSPWYNDFLNDNPQLDYLHVFAKSIKDEDWHPVEVSKQQINKDENMKIEKKEDMTDETTKNQPVTRAEIDTLKSVVTKGFESITGLFKELSVEAHDQEQPSVDKPKETGDKLGGKSREKAMDTEDDTKTKAAKDDTDTEVATDKYALETVQRAITDIQSLTKRIQGLKKAEDTEDDTKTKAADDDTDTKTKAADDTEDETKKKEDDTETDTKFKTMHPLDQLAVTMAKALEAMADKMEKTGTRYPGFEKKIVQDLVSDPKFTEEVQKMMKIPGAKRSVSMGVPYMTTKEGKRYALVAQEATEPIAKSRNPHEGKTFAEVFKKEYSSVRPMDE